MRNWKDMTKAEQKRWNELNRKMFERMKAIHNEEVRKGREAMGVNTRW